MTLTLRIDWSEQDIYGHVNNVSYFKYQQAARVAHWEALDLDNLYEERGVGPVVASVSIQFKKQLHYPGAVRTESRVAFIRNTSFGVDHKMFDDAGDLCAEGHDVIVLYHHERGEAIPVSPRIRQAMEALQGSPIGTGE